LAAIPSAPPRDRAPARRTERVRRWWLHAAIALVLMAGDAVAVNLAFTAIYRWHLGENPVLQAALAALSSDAIGSAVIVFNLTMMCAFIGSGLYGLSRGVSGIDHAFRVLVGVSLGTFGFLIINALQPQFGRDALPFSERVLLFGWIGGATLAFVVRLLHRRCIAWLRAHGIDTRRVLIVGAREPGQAVLARIRGLPELGYRVQGFLSDSAPVGEAIAGMPVLGRIADLGRVLRATRADEVIIAISGRTSSEIFDLVALAEDESVEIKLYPDAFQMVTNNGISVGDVSGLPLISIRNIALDNPVNQLLKRGLDLIVASAVLTICSPWMLLIALIIRLESRGPVFFVQQRVGLDGQPFPTLKFRTMRVDAPTLASWTTRRDPRVTRFGALLRRYSIDELPQFVNVLRGEMSVVGPRPEQPKWVERFSQSIPRYMRRHKQKAGITGWAQVNGLRGDTSIEERTRYDLYYIENWSLLFDCKIIIKTVIDILFGKNTGY
jgi:Undecaprenyl-phosphate glucose phosphotransferase